MTGHLVFCILIIVSCASGADAKSQLQQAFKTDDVTGVESIKGLSKDYFDCKKAKGWALMLQSGLMNKPHFLQFLLSKTGSNCMDPANSKGPPLFNLLLEKGEKIPDEIFSMFLEAKVDVNLEDKEFGNTPLIWASRNGKTKIVQDLITAGAKIDHLNKKNQTALHGAAEFARPEVAKVLLENGADPLVKDQILGYTAVHQAVARGDFLTTEAIVEAIPKKKHKQAFQEKSENGTPLEIAENKKFSSIVRLLKEYGADEKE